MSQRATPTWINPVSGLPVYRDRPLPRREFSTELKPVYLPPSRELVFVDKHLRGAVGAGVGRAVGSAIGVPAGPVGAIVGGAVGYAAGRVAGRVVGGLGLGGPRQRPLAPVYNPTHGIPGYGF